LNRLGRLSAGGPGGGGADVKCNSFATSVSSIILSSKLFELQFDIGGNQSCVLESELYAIRAA
jgi:hypothetical protein